MSKKGEDEKKQGLERKKAFPIMNGAHAISNGGSLMDTHSDPECKFTRRSATYLCLLPSMQAVVYSRGKLYLDGCDFSESSASVLVDGEEDLTVVRNAILGSDNCEWTL